MEWMSQATEGEPEVSRLDGDVVVGTWLRDGRRTATGTALLDGDGVMDFLVLRDERSGVEVHCPGDAVGLDAVTADVAQRLAEVAGFTLPPGQAGW